MEHTRVHRLLKLLSLISSGPGWDSHRLAAELGVDVRTIYRDISGLRQVGLPCEYDRSRRGYKARDGVFLPPVQLSVEEALSLAVLCEQIAEPGAIPFLQAACRAIQKLRGVLPESTREEVGRMLDGVWVRTAASADPCEARDVYDLMTAAVRDRSVLDCRYDSPAGSTRFDFHPYALFFCVRAWYVVGHHGAYDQLRTLKLNRFAQVKRSNRRFDRPESFCLETYLGNAWRMMRGPDVQVELWFDPEFAPTVSDTMWHRTQSIDHHEDGSITFRCTVSGLEEIVWWVLSMGPHCTVKSPPLLAQRVRELAGQTADLYGAPTGRIASGARAAGDGVAAPARKKRPGRRARSA